MRKPNEEFYYYNSIRNQVVVFMSLFKGMKVVDTNDNSETIPEVKETKIDIVYAPKERKYIEMLYDSQDPSSRYDTKVPRFSCSISSITYDQTRTLNTYRKRRIRRDSRQFEDKMPIPYNINMNLNILAKYEGHIHQISENIVPFISPYVIVKIKENIDYLQDIPRELRIDFQGDIGREISLDWADTEKRIIKGSLDFVIKGWIYKPVVENTGGPIMHIPINFFNLPDNIDDSIIIDNTEVSGPNWSQ
jgi:hypothetical protein